MDRKISVVIGAAWGGEGKGLVTDWVSNNQTLNIRYNGGAQAGHTVTLPYTNPLDNLDPIPKTGISKRHVFSHLGAGSFQGGTTYFAPEFIVNPILFRKEWEALVPLDGNIKFPWIDTDCRVTTPFDMLINQEHAKKDKHMTCGVGINETMVRNLSDFGFRYSDIIDGHKFRTKMTELIDGWVPTRCQYLGIEIPYLFKSPKLINDVTNVYIDDVRFLREHSDFCSGGVEHGGDLVFEGAQGLKLCMDNEDDFPYLTPSRPGLDNVIPLLSDLGDGQTVDVYYVTRSYLTRHGAGPLPHEHGMPSPLCVDETNHKNQMQGDLRYSDLDLSTLMTAITKDFDKKSSLPSLDFQKKLVITCLDQTDGFVNFVDNDGIRCRWPVHVFKDMALKKYEFDEVICSYGPTRSTMCHST